MRGQEPGLGPRHRAALGRKRGRAAGDDARPALLARARPAIHPARDRRLPPPGRHLIRRLEVPPSRLTPSRERRLAAARGPVSGAGGCAGRLAAARRPPPPHARPRPTRRRGRAAARAAQARHAGQPTRRANPQQRREGPQHVRFHRPGLHQAVPGRGAGGLPAPGLQAAPDRAQQVRGARRLHHLPEGRHRHRRRQGAQRRRPGDEHRPHLGRVLPAGLLRRRLGRPDGRAEDQHRRAHGRRQCGRLCAGPQDRRADHRLDGQRHAGGDRHRQRRDRHGRPDPRQGAAGLPDARQCRCPG